MHISCRMLLAVVVLVGGVSFAQEQVQQEPAQQAQPQQDKAPQEKPQQLARPNGSTPVDTNQSGAPATDPQSAQPAAPASAPANADWTQPLRMYDGAFVVKGNGQGAREQTYINHCETAGKRYFLCEQIQNRETVMLRIFVPGDDPNHYYVQDVLPSGTAQGRGDLLIDGSRWVFTSQRPRDDGAVDYRRFTLEFSGRDEAKYSVERSDDGQHWMELNTGTEKRQK